MVSSAFAFFLLLALASFHPADPGWSQAGLQGDIHNWVGPVGAWFADILFFAFGSFAFVLPIGSAFLGWFLFQHAKNIEDFDYLTIGLRIIGLILLIIGTTGLLSLNVDDVYTFSAGGMIGDVISASLIPYFSLAGTTLLLLCFVCTGFTLLTGLSWLTIVEKLGEASIAGALIAYKTPEKLKGASIPRLSFRPQQEELAVASGRVGEVNEQQDIQITSLRAEPASDDAEVDETQEFEIPEEVFDTSDSEANNEKPEKKSYALSISELRAKVNRSKGKPASVEQEKPDVAAEDLGPMPSFDLLDRADKVKNPNI